MALVGLKGGGFVTRKRLEEIGKTVADVKQMTPDEQAQMMGWQEKPQPPPALTVSDKTWEYIKKQDEPLNKRAGWNENPLKRYVEDLIKFKKIEVGWRESAGKTDPTMHTKRAWNKVLAKLKKDGIKITEEPVKHKNAYATSHGGFWNSIIYRVV